ncbi:MAG: transporter suffix domain-containing protein [Desulfobacteraceae bacterium]|nr:transporter suffix domain-containing protein [Desulfobacteraceae bacterium]
MVKEKTAKEETRVGWRFRFGMVLFVLGLISPVFIPLVAATGLPVGWKTAISGALMFGMPEFLWVLAAAMMGKTGFNYMKRRFFGFFKKIAPQDTVSRPRYNVGLIMFLLPIIFAWLIAYVPHHIPGYETHRVMMNVIGDLMLLCSLFVLGGDFWDKVRGLFIYTAKSCIPTHESR